MLVQYLRKYILIHGKRKVDSKVKKYYFITFAKVKLWWFYITYKKDEHPPKHAVERNLLRILLKGDVRGAAAGRDTKLLRALSLGRVYPSVPEDDRTPAAVATPGPLECNFIKYPTLKNSHLPNRSSPFDYVPHGGDNPPSQLLKLRPLLGFWAGTHVVCCLFIVCIRTWLKLTDILHLLGVNCNIDIK